MIRFFSSMSWTIYVHSGGPLSLLCVWLRWVPTAYYYFSLSLGREDSLFDMCVCVCVFFTFPDNRSSNLLLTWRAYCWGPIKVQCRVWNGLDELPSLFLLYAFKLLTSGPFQSNIYSFYSSWLKSGFCHSNGSGCLTARCSWIMYCLPFKSCPTDLATSLIAVDIGEVPYVRNPAARLRAPFT